MAFRVPRLLFLLWAIMLLMSQYGHCIKLNDDGGYEIVVALDETTPLPSVGAATYVDNIKTTLRAFSSRLWVATKNHFYLKSADILVPSHWNVNSVLSATTQSFQTADLRLSPNTTYPHADNPNVCGQPGNFIQLPDFFFNITHIGPYGVHWKSLLHEWAIYRFGVHPEHGYIGDSKFPYAVRNRQFNQWTVTGCSDEPIQGTFIDIANPDDTSCESSDTFSSTCRFYPSEIGQNATTSLMHFHWIESVTEFCDEHNHNKHAQNKQNALCDYKSVWEIIRESPDYVTVTSPRHVSVPAVTFKTVKHSPKPLFYILLDRGLVQGSFAIAQSMQRLLSNLLNNENLRNNVASVGAFPGVGNNPLVDLVEWSELGLNSNAFVDAVGLLRNDGPLERDFSRALVAVADKIKATNHPNGAVVLLLKYGADVKNFGGYLPESEVFNALNEGNIIFNSIELNFADHTGFSHLARVAQETGGSYVTLNNFGEAETSIRNVLNYVHKTLETEYKDLRKNWTTIRKEALYAATTTIPVPSDIKGSLQIFVSANNADLIANFSLEGNSYKSQTFLQDLSFRVYRFLDWNEQGSKFTYRLDIPQSQLEGVTQLTLRLHCGMSSSCARSVLARAQFTGQSEVKIELSTSSQSGTVDLSQGRPVSVYAKVTKKGNPVRDATVIATLTDIRSFRTTTIRLLDDGGLAPDAQELDGIYSAYFAPANDGQFRMSVTVQGNTRRRRSVKLLDNKLKAVSQNSSTRLLPIDQGDIGCGTASCDSEIIEGDFSQTVELSSTFNIANASLYRPAPTKILSLLALDMPALQQVTMFWRTPDIPGRWNTVSSYELKTASSLELLISNFDDQTTVPLPPGFRPNPIAEMISIERPTATAYYAIRSGFGGKTSPISNIVSVIIENPVTTPPTTLSPPTTPTSSSDPTGPTSSPTTGDPSGPTSSPTTRDPTGPTSSPTTRDPTGSTNPSTTSGTTDDGTTTSDEITTRQPTNNPSDSPPTTPPTTSSTSSTPEDNSPGSSGVKIESSICLLLLIGSMWMSVYF